MKVQKQTVGNKSVSLKSVQRLFFRTQLVLIISLALILGVAGMLINIHFETEKRDQNLKNVAEAIARSPILTGNSLTNGDNKKIFSQYLDTLKETLDDIDVISVVDKDGIRMYHSNHSLIGTQYDGNIPDFESKTKGYYAVDENGPSGSQRRTYAAVYNESGEYVGKLKYDDIVAQLAGKQTELDTANDLIAELKKGTKGNEELQGKITGYETQVADLQAQLAETKTKSALKVGLLAEKCLDIDYVSYVIEKKLKEQGKALELDENENIKGWEELVSGVKTQLPTQFESAKGGKEFEENPLPEGDERKSEPQNLAEALRMRYENNSN